MSFSAMAWALKVRTGSPTLKAVLLAVANYADEDGVCWPTQARLAFDTELTDRAVRGALATLEEKGLIVRERRQLAGLKRLSDLIRLCPRSVPEPASATDLPERPSGTVPERGSARSAVLPERGSATVPERGSVSTGTTFRIEPIREPPVEEKESSLRSPKKGHRLPDDWKPDDGLLEFAVNEGLTNSEFNRAADEFRDFWHAMSGTKATKLDWTKTFRNRLREVADRKRRGIGNVRSGSGWLESVERAFNGIDRDLSPGHGGEAGEPVYSRLPSARQRN